ncbi:MAG: IS1595 family transposase [Bryobacteraceae bacterium]
MERKATLQDAILYFADFENCRRFMTELRWPDGTVKCPVCGAANVTWLAKRRVWKCYADHPKPTFSLKTGTIFEDSPIPLGKWLPAAWLLISCKNGISSYELHRDLGVTQKTAWFMLQRIRLAMQNGGFAKLSGEVEVDESYIGGKARNMHKSRKLRLLEGKGGGHIGKVAVQGMLQRDGEVRARVIENTQWQSVVPAIHDNVEAGSHLYTDEVVAYFGLRKDYAHKVINHAESYVDGQVHTNGTYISVEPFHLFRYIDEQVFRFNTRKITDAERFSAVMKQIVGRRLTYKELTGKTEDAYG